MLEYVKNNKSSFTKPVASYFGREYLFDIINSGYDYKISEYSYPPSIKFNEKKFITFPIGDKSFCIDKRLEHIFNSIKNSKKLLRLKDDWDDEGSLATDSKTYLASINFLINYSMEILKNNIIIEAPDIDILRDGSIVLNWESDFSTFTIIFKKDSNTAFYYAKNKSNPVPLRYGININKDIDKLTVTWMLENLKFNQTANFR